MKAHVQIDRPDLQDGGGALRQAGQDLAAQQHPGTLVRTWTQGGPCSAPPLSWALEQMREELQGFELLRGSPGGPRHAGNQSGSGSVEAPWKPGMSAESPAVVQK